MLVSSGGVSVAGGTSSGSKGSIPASTRSSSASWASRSSSSFSGIPPCWWRSRRNSSSGWSGLWNAMTPPVARPIGPFTSAVPLPRNHAIQDEGPAVQGRRTHPRRAKRCEAEDSRGTATERGNAMPKPFADARSIYHVIEPALWAPSVYNSQPWSFRITTDDRIELRANVSDSAGARRGRWDLLLHSPAPGPWAREYAIGCGAALMNLRLAIRMLGHDPVIALVPAPDSDPGLLASVEIVAGRTREPKELEKELYEAIRQRHTDRRPFSAAPVHPGVLVEIERAAAREDGWLRVLHGPYARRWLKASAGADAAIAVAGRSTDPAAGDSWGLAGGDGGDGGGTAADATVIAAADDAAASGRLSYDALLHQFRGELTQWTGHSEDGCGVALTASGPRPARARSPVRDFSLGAADSGSGSGPADSGVGSGADNWSARARRHAQRGRFERHPQLMMLFTDRDDPADWLRAGQALQRALL